jgi:hypothetical protein
MAKVIYDHPLIVDALKGLQAHLKANERRLRKPVLKGATLRAQKPRPPKSVATRYQYMVFHQVTKIATDLDCLEDIVRMVRRMPTSRTLKTWKLSADKWLEYQYTLHLVTLGGAVDRSLQTVNAVLNLGLAPQDCTEQLLLRHSRVAGTRIGAAVKRVLSETQPFRRFRNLDVHRKDLPPFYEIVGFEEYDWLPALALMERTGKELVEPRMLHDMFRQSGKSLALRMQKERTKLKTVVWKLFDVLAPLAKSQALVFSLYDHSASNMALNATVGRGRPPAR